MDTEEMSRRGIEDAELGAPNPFYYQHYYHYRRSFDRARRQQRTRVLQTRAGVGVAALVVLFGIGAAIFLRPPGKPELPAASVATATLVVTPTPKPLFPTPTPAATIAATTLTNALTVDGFAVVSNTSGKSLRARSKPNLQAQVQTTFREGERVRVLEGPVEGDGLRWWRVEGSQGSGWSAELSPNGEVLLVPSS